MVTEAEYKNKKYCSMICANSDNVGILECSEANTKLKEIRFSKIRDICDKHVNQNKDEFLNIKLNAISSNTTITDMVNEIKSNTGIIDMRTICTAICGYPSRKTMIKYLKRKLEGDQND